MSASAEFDAVAQRATALAKELSDFAAHVRRIGNGAADVLGGGATGADRQLLARAADASRTADQAAALLTKAAGTARTAADTERRREAEAQREKSGRR